jgi:hypothetical protein
MYWYPERRLRVEKFDCQLPPEAWAELGAKPRVVQPRRESEPSPPSSRQSAPVPEVAISPPRFGEIYKWNDGEFEGKFYAHPKRILSPCPVEVWTECVRRFS